MAEVRITETGEDRLTEDGETRVVDASVHFGSLTLTSGLNLLEDFQGGSTVLLGELELIGNLIVTTSLTVSPAPIDRPIPQRFYIWVYNLAGERVDVIA